MNTYTDEEKKYIEGMDLSRLPEHAAPVVIAVGQYNQGEIITAKCPYCSSMIKVEGKGNPTCAWIHSCDCGKCNGTFKDL